MKANNIYIQSIPSLKIKECKIVKEINKHFTARIKGYLTEKSQDNFDDYMHKEDINIVISNDDDEQHSIFKGIITQICISPNDDFYEVALSAESYTLLLDIENRFRVFQDDSWTYKRIAKYIVGCNDNAISIYNQKTDIHTNSLLVQYKETDWEFLKRIAAELNTVLISDCKNDKASFYFGIPERTHTFDFSYLSLSKKFTISDTRKIMEYVVESRDILNLLDKVSIEGNNVQVFAIDIQLTNGEILSRYVMRQLKDFYANKYHNSNLIGVSITGRVTNVKDTQVQVDIDGELVKNDNKKWFDFATVYSSYEGTGWYCMPENGDKIRLYFPDDDEESSYVISSVHYEETEDLRTKPEEKFIRTIHKKEIRLTPTKIILTNHKGMEIVLDDDSGIIVKSKKDIEIRSNGSISIESGDGIQVEANTGIYLRQNKNVLMVKDGILEQAMNIEHR